MDELLKSVSYRLLGRRMSRKHVRALMRYSTPRKLVNLAMAETERWLRRTRPRALPYTAAVDVTNRCNLHCTYCPTGRGRKGRVLRKMGMEEIERFLDQLGKYLFLVHLYNWGEPLLHPQISRIIRAVHQRKIGTSISTNLNVRKPGLLEDLCDARLDWLILSIDGASQDVYQRYRQGGDLELVLENIRRLVEYKRAKRLHVPVLEWQFLEFEHNRHELDEARATARSLGIDVFTARKGLVPKELAVPSRDSQSPETICPHLWNTIVFQADGGLSPCWNLFDAKDDFGEFPADSVGQAWRSERYQLARAMFAPARARELPRDLDHPCLYCPYVWGQAHMAGYLEQNSHLQRGAARGVVEGLIAVRSSPGSPCCVANERGGWGALGLTRRR